MMKKLTQLESTLSSTLRMIYTQGHREDRHMLTNESTHSRALWFPFGGICLMLLVAGYQALYVRKIFRERKMY